MNRKSSARTWVGAISVVLVFSYIPTRLVAQVVSLDPAKMPRIATVDERFQSYNIEMVEVIGGRFWKPYSSHATNASTTQPSDSTPAGMDPELYQYRPPIDLSKSRLRKLAAALGPAYVRISGTWANTVYFQNSDNPAPANAPSPWPSELRAVQRHVHGHCQRV